MDPYVQGVVDEPSLAEQRPAEVVPQSSRQAANVRTRGEDPSTSASWDPLATTSNPRERREPFNINLYRTKLVAVAFWPSRRGNRLCGGSELLL